MCANASLALEARLALSAAPKQQAPQEFVIPALEMVCALLMERARAPLATTVMRVSTNVLAAPQTCVTAMEIALPWDSVLVSADSTVLSVQVFALVASATHARTKVFAMASGSARATRTAQLVTLVETRAQNAEQATQAVHASTSVTPQQPRV